MRIWRVHTLTLVVGRLAVFSQEADESGSGLLELLGDLGGDSVHVGGALLGQGVSDASNVLEGDLADQRGVLELLQAVADHLTGGESSVLSADAVPLLRAVVLTQGLHTAVATHVQLVGEGGGADVEPVSIVRGKVLEAGGLVVHGPLS